MSFDTTRTAVHRVQLHWICLSRSHQLNPQCYYGFTRSHLTPREATWSPLVLTETKNAQVRKWCLPVFFRCMRLGCSRFPPSCSGTPATSVCCSSPGLGSFLRPRSAASWAPRIGRRTETGTCFINTLKRANTAREAVWEDKGVSEWKYLLCWRWFKETVQAWPRRIAAVYLQCSSDHLTWDWFQWAPQGGAVIQWTRPPGILIKRRAVTRPFILRLQHIITFITEVHELLNSSFLKNQNKKN